MRDFIQNFDAKITQTGTIIHQWNPWDDCNPKAG